MAGDNYWTRPLSRRRAVRGAVLGAMGLAGAALLGCGESEEASPVATAATTGTSGAGLATATAASTEEAKRGGKMRVIITADPTTLDPYKTASSPAHTFISYFYSRLLKFETQPGVEQFDQAVTGDLAESFETDDGQTWTFNLRKGVKWHNVAPVSGREFTSADVKYNWERLTDESTIARSNVENVSTVEYPDDYTVKFTLAAPSAVFPIVMADMLVMQVMPFESADQFDPLTKPIGTGPFIMDQYQVGASASMKANPDYYEAGIPYLDEIEVLVIPEYANGRAQLEAGAVHTLAIQPDDLLGVIERHADWQWRYTQGAVGYLFWSSEEQLPGAPWLDDRYRKAVSMAMDREAVNELAYNNTELEKAGLPVSWDTNNVVPRSRGSWWLDPRNPGSGDSGQWFEYNLAEAKKLLSAGGWDGTDVEFHYPTTQYGPVYELTVQHLGNEMEQLGLKVTLVPEDYAAVYFPQTRAGIFKGVSLGSAASYPDAGGYVDRFFSHTASNASMVRDAQLDELRAKQASELDIEARRELIHQIQRVNGENMYYCPTNYGSGYTYTAYLPNVRNLATPRGPIQSEVYPYMWFA